MAIRLKMQKTVRPKKKDQYCVECNIRPDFHLVKFDMLMEKNTIITFTSIINVILGR